MWNKLKSYTYYVIQSKRRESENYHSIMIYLKIKKYDSY